MISKERVLTAVARRQPDRVPLDFSANAFVLERLHWDLGTASPRQLLDRFDLAATQPNLTKALRTGLDTYLLQVKARLPAINSQSKP